MDSSGSGPWRSSSWSSPSSWSTSWWVLKAKKTNNGVVWEEVVVY